MSKPVEYADRLKAKLAHERAKVKRISDEKSLAVIYCALVGRFCPPENRCMVHTEQARADALMRVLDGLVMELESPLNRGQMTQKQQCDFLDKLRNGVRVAMERHITVGGE